MILFYSRKIKRWLHIKTIKQSKRYNIVIIPERGGRATHINLHHKFLKASIITTLSILFIILLGSFVFYINYKAVKNESFFLEETNKDITASEKEKNAYIKVLEDKNKENEEKLSTYKTYQDTINEKMQELEALEDAVQNKLDNSLFFKTQALADADYSPLLLSTPLTETVSLETAIIKVDTHLKSLQKLDVKLTQILEEEKYMPSMLPATGTITSTFSTRINPFTRRNIESHKGVDIANSYGTPIYASAKGTVSYASYQSGYGYMVQINHGNGIETLYGHNSKLLVELGQEVEKGESIALMGSTGQSTGVHVHFEVHKDSVPINPMNILQ